MSDLPFVLQTPKRCKKNQELFRKCKPSPDELDYPIVTTPLSEDGDILFEQ